MPALLPSAQDNSASTHTLTHNIIVMSIIAVMLMVIIVQLNVSKETGTRRSVTESVKWVSARIRKFFGRKP
ncbi:hypothetical protein DYU05_08795 [Mucilaginibacter terrenus]|uniref:Uncharacterized protein n=1 Tax=Mucilaginibacter terrenus TaxID=2482727 RepID=A0A3E2NXG6_9SPHI|nr:hypothetical protein [Mucilaginibacter terrenus]RFZ85677.1 hypothetical protein DYU05_08795 [Mucilaginibacter terrenus]